MSEQPISDEEQALDALAIEANRLSDEGATAEGIAWGTVFYLKDHPKFMAALGMANVRPRHAKGNRTHQITATATVGGKLVAQCQCGESFSGINYLIVMRAFQRHAQG